MLLLAVLLPLLLCAPRSRRRAKKFSLSAPLVSASSEPWLPKSRRLLPVPKAEVAGLPVLFSRTLPPLLFVFPGVYCERQSLLSLIQFQPHRIMHVFYSRDNADIVAHSTSIAWQMI